ncbi:MAG: phage shock protein operon transcriptional activator [Halieaceae bacterium]|nr:phage shock protein operon transcriptional activator [Halieaceae bacterium]RPG89313.1 MAG: phage shock protein operon transcriptional activator [Cellvibrionales bacterium TMED157]
METMQTVIGESHALNTALDHISNLAGIDRSILVTGERGTGKEIAANRLHFLSSRWQGPFIKLNCASLPETLLDSELFGYEPGAFTGARRSHQGRFERADEGTLLLDELGTMPLALQEKLLRVIEYGELERVGGSQTIKVDVRIVAATNADLPTMATKGKFRWDLLDRLTFDVVNMPPLRTRDGDITLLAEHFAVRFAAESGWHHFPGFSPNAKGELHRYHWPGNVRELRNVIERSLHRQGEDGEQIAELVINPWPDRPIEKSDTPTPETPSRNDLNSELPGDLRAALDQQEASWLEQALSQTAHNQKQAAALLGLSYDQIRGLMRKHGLRSRSLRS